MYLYKLPTTGAVTFSEFCIDLSNEKAYTSHFSNATQARANLRGILKGNKRTDHNEKDYLSLVKVVEEYIPHISAILNCVAHHEIGIRIEPTFSWRTTLSAQIFNNSPRIEFPGIYADYSLTLLTYAFALCNLAYTIVSSVGIYEHDRTISDVGRKSKEDQLNVAVDFLCRASGVFTYIGETVLLDWDINKAFPTGFHKPPDISREVSNALAKMSLADAQTLAIRRLLSKSAYDSNIVPGPPLPKSHPPPALLAKLHIECSSLYSSARLLAKTPEASKNSSGESNMEVCTDLRRYLGNQTVLHSALSHKWLGVETGEKGGTEKGGEAVAFLHWAKKELEELKDERKLINIGNVDKEQEERWKSKVADELSIVDVFYKYYKKMNDTLCYQPVPTQKDLQSRVPGGRIAIPAKSYTPPAPAFGPGSVEYTHRKSHELEQSGSLPTEHLTTESLSPPAVGKYAGAGAYF